MATNITEEHRRAFDALKSGRYDNFCLFSCYVDGEPAAAIAAVSVHEPDGRGRDRVRHPPAVRLGDARHATHRPRRDRGVSPASPGGRNPFRVPRPAVVSFSGGRTSAYMLKHIVDAYGGELPDDIAVVYANTGLERPETLDFIDTCATAWGVPIVWVEYDWDAPHRTRLVDYRTASRTGEPYAALIERKGFVPNATLRYCTGFLKRDRIESYARYRLGLKRWHAVIGLRADEPRRVWRMRAMDCGSRTGGRAALPLADAGVAERDVLAWWKGQPFDLGLPGYAGNCACCFLKGRGKLLHIIREDPSLADWWFA